MAILQAVLILLVRQMGRVLNTAFGWATSMLFGQVPQHRRYLLTAIAIISLLWLIVALGIALPEVGAYLLAFVRVPEWVDPNYVRLGMLGGALVLPLLVGLISYFLKNPAQRGKGWFPIMRAIFKGYPYTLGLALTMLAMIVVAPLMKFRDLINYWSVRHIPIVVDAKDYFTVLETMQKSLELRGFPTKRHRASPLLRWPTRVFTFLAGSAADGVVARELAVLRGKDLEILLHPSDLIIRGRSRTVARVFGVLSETMAFTQAHFTWSKEARELENKLNQIWNDDEHTSSLENHEHAEELLQRLRQQLQTVSISSEEWEVLFRELLLIECKVLRRISMHVPHPEHART